MSIVAPIDLGFDCRFRYPSGFELDAAFGIEPGVTGLVGPSGSGKSTVLALIAGLLRPVSGRITLGEEVLVDTEQSSWTPPARRSVGLLFQDLRLLPHLRVGANLTYGAKRRRGRGPDYDHIVEALRLGDLLRRFPRTLSGGQQQRVALARTLLSNPRVLLLDEPFRSVEADLRDAVAELLQEVAQQLRLPTLVISHDQRLIDGLAQEVLHLRDGAVCGA